jgi:hypothetical protein
MIFMIVVNFGCYAVKSHHNHEPAAQVFGSAAVTPLRRDIAQSRGPEAVASVPRQPGWALTRP